MTLDFDSDVTAFSGAATLGLEDLGEIRRNVAITDAAETARLLVSASGVSATVGTARPHYA